MERTEIKNGVEIVDLGLLFVADELLAITDLQFGYEEHLNRQGILVPRHAHRDMLERIEGILKECCSRLGKGKKKIHTVLLNGDIKHEFGRISETEWRHCVRFLKLVSKYTQKIVLVKGNHDTLLDPIAQTRDLEVVDHYILDGRVLFVHGDTLPEADVLQGIETVVIGHEHPAISIVDWPRVEKYKVFLHGTWKRKKLIVLPSFHSVTQGTDVLSEQLLSPFLAGRNLSRFRVYVVMDDVYDFGTVSAVKKLNKSK